MTVVAIALAMGPTQGAVAGFTAGILIDLAPPADTLLGVNAIVYIAIGFVTGVAIDPRDRTVPIMIGVVGLSAAAAAVGTAALDTLLGSDRVDWGEMPGMVLTSCAVRRDHGPAGDPGGGVAGPPGDARGPRRVIAWRDIRAQKPHSGASGTGRPSHTSYRHT